MVSDLRAQGTVEYLVIIGVVVVISLVVVGLLTDFAGSSEQISGSSSKLNASAQVIGVIESLVDPSDGNFVVKLLNNAGGNITVSNVKVGDTNVNFSEDMAQGGSKFFRVDTSVLCEEGKVVSQDVTITYVTEYGLTKTMVYPAKVMFDCTPYVITQANLANQCPSCGSSCSGGSQSLSASSVSVAAGCYTATDLNVVDSDLTASNIKSGTAIFGLTGTLSSGGVPKTGQTISYVNYDDGYYEKGLPTSGAHYTDNSDNTITDNATGLDWIANPATVSGPGYNFSNQYAWADAITAIQSMNAANYAGHNDWRLPNFKELVSILDFGRFSPSIDPIFTSESNNYWSSSTHPSNNINALYVNFNSCYAWPANKSNDMYYVRPVRGN